jgi:hypothetical protein
MLAVATAALAALGLSGRRRVSQAGLELSSMFVSYRAESQPARAYPEDREIEQAVQDLIGEPSPSLSPTDEKDLRTVAAALAERSSWIASPRPSAPSLPGDLVGDVFALTGISRSALAEALGAAPAEFAPGREEGQLPAELRHKLAALRAAGVALYGGLGAAGVGQWLATGTPTPIAAIAAGRVAEVRAKLDRYMTSPTE